MSKSILVLNTPNCCKDCDCYFNNGNSVFCCITRTDIEDSLLINDDCPLKPMPQRKEEWNYKSNVIFDDRFNRGFNACIDEILGEGEE